MNGKKKERTNHRKLRENKRMKKKWPKKTHRPKNEMGESIKIVFKALERNDSGNEITGNSSKWNTLREKSSALHFAACHHTHTPFIFTLHRLSHSHSHLSSNKIMYYKYLLHMKIPMSCIEYSQWNRTSKQICRQIRLCQMCRCCNTFI